MSEKRMPSPDSPMHATSAERDDDSAEPRRRGPRKSGGGITLRDVAQLAGVAPITASRALKTPGQVSDEVRKRVADALLTLQSKYQKENQERFSMHISREDLANIAGTATESLIRTLSDFKSEKLIEISEGNIIITNQKKLAAMLN